MALPTFTLFCNLPLELRSAIWVLGAPDPSPEVCIVSPLNIRIWEGEQPTLPLTVDIPWPAIAHVSQEARACILAAGVFRLRHSVAAEGLMVPYRAFDPEIDTLYWGRHQASAMHAFFTRTPANEVLARSLRHVAVEVAASYPQSDLAEIIRGKAVFLRSLALVLPDSAEDSVNHTSEFALMLPPARRCRLRDIPHAVARDIVMVGLPFLGTGATLSLPEYLNSRRADLDDHVRRFDTPGEEGPDTAWRAEDRCFAGLEIKAQTFVQYTTSQSEMAQPEGRWVEVCGQRKLEFDGREPRYIRPSDRRNPEVYRVLDDDSTLEEMPPFGIYYELELGLNSWHGNG